MTVYAVTGASGQLGRLVVEQLLERGVDPGDVVAVVRTPEKVADLAARGVQVRHGDYTEPDSLATAFSGVDRLLLVSSNAVGKRIEEHGNAVRAAEAAGVSALVYTSLTHADVAQNPLAPEHRATEELLAASALPTTVLRNNWYTENYTGQLGQYFAQGAIVSAAGDGRVAPATRADYAAAAAAALTGDFPNTTFELAGPVVTLSEIADTITEVTGTAVAYRAVSGDELVATLTGAGLDEATAGFVAALDAGIARGDLDIDSPDLAELLGRPATPLAEAIRAAKE